MKRPKTLQEEAAELRRAWHHFTDVLGQETGFYRLMGWLVHWLARKTRR